jgi:hypothetical protein
MKKNKDLYDSFRKAVCGGPSLVFSRYHHAGQTKIRPTYSDNPNLCQTVLGYDANSLYLKCLSEDMPVGFFFRRKEEHQFRLEAPMRQSQACLEWLSHVEATEGCSIQHVFKTGRECRLGGRQIPVDGFDKANNTVYQFHGCYWHGHANCFLSKGLSEEKQKERASHTDEIEKYLGTLGVNMRVMRECEWMCYKRVHPEAKPPPQSPAWKQGCMTEEEILHLVISGELFGIVEVDIHVPDHLREKFEEFCPIFKNTEVGLEDIGPHMRQFAEVNNLLRTPQRCLISSLFANKTMIITPLLSWYLQKGLKVTKVYQVVQFQKSACFQSFANQVTEARRAADSDPSKAAVGATFKLLVRFILIF